jgi:hypothetical protein
MFAMIEIIVHIDEAGIIWIAVSFYVPQQLDLIQCLIHVIFVVEYHLQAVSLFLVCGSEIFHLDCLAELCLAQNTHDLKPACQNLVYHYCHLSLLLKPCLFAIVYNFQVMAIVNNSS